MRHAVEERAEIDGLQRAFDEPELPRVGERREVGFLRIAPVVVREAIETDDVEAARGEHRREM